LVHLDPLKPQAGSGKGGLLPSHDIGSCFKYSYKGVDYYLLMITAKINEDKK